MALTGKQETTSDCLKSLMAMYLFRYQIALYSAAGVNFRKYMYVPEGIHHDREDHNHLLKRIGTCLRNGSMHVDLRYFVDALKDSHSGLTYTALSGQRKQNVPDVERLFSTGVANFMDAKGHEQEAKVVRVVLNWHKANDGRGLSEEIRSQYNYDMLSFLLDDWMPWHVYNRDFSALDINRFVSKYTHREVSIGAWVTVQ